MFAHEKQRRNDTLGTLAQCMQLALLKWSRDTSQGMWVWLLAE